MKKIGACQNCERTVYTNDIELCKKCHSEVGFKFLATADIEEEIEEGPSMEELGLEETSEVVEGTEEKVKADAPETAPAEEAAPLKE